MTLLAPQIDLLRRLQPREIAGTVRAVRGLTIEVDDLPLPIGSLVMVQRTDRIDHEQSLRGEIVGFNDTRSLVMLLGTGTGLAPGARVIGTQTAQTVQVGQSLLGRVINGLGQPIDGGATPSDTVPRELNPPPTGALQRRRITEPLPTGVRAIDAMLTFGKGQRIGIFSGPGVGKSTLLSTIARNTKADINVIALIGERGREVRDFLDHALGAEGMARSVVIVATSDESPLMRVRAASVACAVAEYFRDLGQDVMLMMDSITRFAQAQRQIGLAIGEQPATKGYTPSVFAMLPVLLERAGSIEGRGSITGLYSVLVEGDDLTEPISDAARGVLDGHLVLSRKIAVRGFYPAIDLLDSVSRVADDVCDANHIRARGDIVKLIAAYAESEELIAIGAYAKGSNPMCDVAIDMKPELDDFFRQTVAEKAEYPVLCRRLIELAGAATERLAQHVRA